MARDQSEETRDMSEYKKQGYLSQLYVQVLIGIVAGGLLGFFWPQVGASLQPIADGFIKLIKMLLSPIIFGTVVVGIAKMSNIREVGRIGVKALIYFEIVSTLALVIGLVVVNVMKPGAGMNIDVSRIDASAISGFVKAADGSQGFVKFILDVIPTTIVDAFAKGAMLQVILISVFMGVALVQLGERGKALVDVIDILLQALFRIVAMVMRLAPLGAGAGIAFTIGKYGIGTIWSLGYLMLGVYVTTIAFIVIVLGTVAWWSGFPLTQFFRYFKDEILIVLGTCSTEAVMPQMLASKGSAGVAGAGFITLAAKLASIHTVPVAGLVLLLGVDRFMNEARAVTNLIGNGVATIAIAKWDGAFDASQAAEVMRQHGETRSTPAPRA